MARQRRARNTHEQHHFVIVAHQLEHPWRVLMSCHFGARYAGCAATEVREAAPAAIATLPRRKAQKEAIHA